MKKLIVISLGGSLIVPEKMNHLFLSNFKDTLRKSYHKYKFVLVCGGGAIARRYISALRTEHKTKKELALAGMRATRMNAQFIIQLFGKEANDTLPSSMQDVKDNLSKNKVVICGALRYSLDSTSDGTAAKLAHFLKTDFINMTDVEGLYTANPKTNFKAKFISKISWKDFAARALKINFEVGQHFVLDQQAALLIKKHKIKTYIVGPDLKNLSRLLEGGKFRGTRIGG
jgi:uridylate kinase